MTDPTLPRVGVAGSYAVRARAVSKVYGTTIALWRIDLEVHAGESVAVAGPNGSGKSTLLRVLAGLTSLTSGEVDREAVSGPLRVALVSHRTHLLDALTPLENLSLTRRLSRTTQDPELMLRALGVDSSMRRPCRELSAGTVRRVAIARALTATPDALLLDEPFAGLDREAGDLVEAALRGYVEHQGILILSSHDEERAGRVAARTIRLDRGRVVGAGNRPWA